MAGSLDTRSLIWGMSVLNLLAASAYDDVGLSYRLPDYAHAERSGKW